MHDKRTHVAWTTAEEATLRKMFEAGDHINDIAKALPRHTQSGVQSFAWQIGLERPVDYVQPHFSKGWARAEEVMRSAGVGMTADEISKASGVNRNELYKLLKHRRGRVVYVCEWQRTNAKRPTAIWALGNRPDAPPLPTHRNKAPKVNPFAAALGLVKPLETVAGRVYIHLTDSKDDKFAEAA